MVKTLKMALMSSLSSLHFLSDMTNTTTQYQATLTHNLRVLAEAYKKQFAEALYSDERFTDLCMNKAAEFVMETMPAIDEEHEMDVALMLMETVKLDSF
jgi:hypothetical protein